MCGEYHLSRSIDEASTSAPLAVSTKLQGEKFAGSISIFNPGSKPSSGIQLVLRAHTAETYKVPSRDLMWVGQRGGLQLYEVDAATEPASALSIYFAVIKADASYSYLATINRFVHELANLTGGMIWDAETEELFSAPIWKKQRIDSVEASDPSSIVRANTLVRTTSEV